MSQALRKMVGIVKKSNCLCIFINQIREKIGVLFGNPETTTGGNALKFYASMRLEVRKSTAVKDGDEKTKKMLDFKGINRFGEILDKAIEFDIIHKSGSWFSYEGTKLGQGKNAVITLLNDNPEVLEEIEAKVIQQISNKDNGIYEFEDILQDL